MSNERAPNFYQDWDPVIIKNRAVEAANAKAVRQKTGHYSQESEMMRKLANADGPMKPKSLTSESKQQMITLRLANKWSQADLNTRCGFPANTIREIEAGRLCPSPGMLNVLNRTLKCGLRYAL